MIATADAMDSPQTRFAALLEQHRGIVFKVAATYCRHRDDRQDVAQEIAAQLWRAYPGYDPTRPFSTWMYRIALNVAISHVGSAGASAPPASLAAEAHASPPGLAVDAGTAQHQADHAGGDSIVVVVVTVVAMVATLAVVAFGAVVIASITAVIAVMSAAVMVVAAVAVTLGVSRRG